MEVVYVDIADPDVEPTNTDYQEPPISTRPSNQANPMNYLTPEKLKDPRLARYKPIERRLPTKRTSLKSPPPDAVYASLVDYLSATLW
jgi:hypothetical protein